MSLKHSKSFILKEKMPNQKIFKEAFTELDLKLRKSFDLNGNIPINDCLINSPINKEKETNNNGINYKNFICNTKNYDILQINFLKKLEKNENSTILLEDLKNLQDQCPIINKFSDVKILCEEDFDIFQNEDSSKFGFVVNAANTINLVNFLWDCFSQKVESFVTSLAELNIYFSYVKKENIPNAIDCILMTSIPSFLYNYISSNSGSQFKNKKMKSLADKYSKSKEKTIFDKNYCYQNMISLSFLEKAGIDKNSLNPTIMYYLKKEISKKLIDLKIIIPPEKYSLYSLSEKNKSIEHKGFEKINLSFSLMNDVILNQDYNFSLINGKMDSPIGQKIVLNAGYTYIVDIKINIEDIIKKMKQIEKIEKKFIESYKNIVVSGNKIYHIDKYQLLLVSDKNIYDSSNKLEEKIKTKNIKKNINNFIYSSPQLGINVILDLQKVIRNLTTELEELKKERYKEVEKNYKESKLLLKTLFPPIIPTIILNLKKNNFQSMNKLNSFLNCFNEVSKNLMAYKKDLLFYKIFPFIGNPVKCKEKKYEWEKIKKLIMGKINENKIWSN